jgi:glycosyltransferase involved in cell wall biosynthesis
VEGISVVIPLYNGEAFLRPCLESVLRQDHGGPLEILVGDDGSRDGGAAVAGSFGAPVRVLRHPGAVNRGVSATRNLCIRAARQPLIALLDADDLWWPGHLAALTAALARDPGAGLAYDNGSYLTADGRPTGEGFTYPPPTDAETLLANCCVFPSGVLVRRAAFDRVGLFDETLRYCEDYDMLLRIFEVFRVIHVPVDGYLYRRHGEQASQSVDRMCRSAAHVVCRARARYPYPKALIRGRHAVFAYRRGQAALREGRYLSGLYHLGRAALRDPRRAVGEVARALGRAPAKQPIGSAS